MNIKKVRIKVLEFADFSGKMVAVTSIMLLPIRFCQQRWSYQSHSTDYYHLNTEKREQCYIIEQTLDEPISIIFYRLPITKQQ